MGGAGAWMPLYIGDYLADTMHLSGPEHGAYLLLIMHYWRNGPLPDDDRTLAAIARTDRKSWNAETGPTVRAFFKVSDGRLHHKRIDRELADASANIDQKRAAARARWSRETTERKTNGHAGAYASEDTAAHADAKRLEYPSPSPSPSPERRKNESATHSLRVIVAEHDRFWQMFPKKVGKGASIRAWTAACRVAPPADIIAGLQAQLDAQSFASERRYIPNPATWLNAHRWSDEIRGRDDDIMRAAGLFADGEPELDAGKLLQ